MKTKFKFLSSIFIVMIMVAGTLSTSAQAKPFTSRYGFTKDTVINTGSKTLSCVNYNPAQEVQVQVLCKNITGTMAGKVIIKGSDDDSTFVQLYQRDSYNVRQTDSLSPTGSSSTKIWTYNLHGTTQPLPRYFQAIYTGSGTDSARFSATLYVLP